MITVCSLSGKHDFIRFDSCDGRFVFLIATTTSADFVSRYGSKPVTTDVIGHEKGCLHYNFKGSVVESWDQPIWVGSDPITSDKVKVILPLVDSELNWSNDVGPTYPYIQSHRTDLHWLNSEQAIIHQMDIWTEKSTGKQALLQSYTMAVTFHWKQGVLQGYSVNKSKFVTYDYPQYPETPPFPTGMQTPDIRRCDFGRPRSDWVYQELRGKEFPLVALVESFNRSNPHLARVTSDLVSQSQYNAAQSAQSVDVNTSMYARDLICMGALVRQVKAIATKQATAKTAADTYLLYKYGIASFEADSRQIIKGWARKKFFSHGLEWVRGGTSTIVNTSFGPMTCAVNSKIGLEVYDNYMQQFMLEARRLGLYVSGKDVWDAVPFSFIVNWFSDIDEKLEYSNTVGFMDRLPVSTVVSSTRLSGDVTKAILPYVKSTFPWSTPSWVSSASINFVLYERSVGGTLSPPKGPEVGRAFHNYVDLAAVIVQHRG